MNDILLVDDREDQRYTLDKLLHGYHTVHASSGHEALSLCTTNIFSLIIMDVKVPSGMGLDVVANLREISYDTPILFYTHIMSNFQLLDDLARVQVGCVCKSDSTKTLIDKVETLLLIQKNKRSITAFRNKVV